MTDLEVFPDMTFAGVTCDSRQVRPGWLYVAVPGFKRDGADFAAAAVAAGAAAVVAEHPIPGLSVPTAVVEKARYFLGCKAAALAGYPSHKVRVWGITGTNGKTTTSWILGDLLGDAGLITTVETYTGRRTFASDHTTPDAETLQSLFAEMVSAGQKDCVMEVSSHAVALSRTAGTRFAGAAFTNLTEDHLDFHKTMENYFDVKRSFFLRLAEENPGAPAAVCVDGPYGARLAETLRSQPLRLTVCGLSVDRGMTFSDGSLPDTDWRALIAAHCPLAGRYNIQNVLTAVSLAQAAGVPLQTLQTRLPELTPRWGRLERVPTHSAAEVFVDFAHTDDALANVLSTVRAFTKGRVWAVFGAGGDRDRRKRPLMGAAAAAHADRLIVTSDNPRHEDPEAIIREIIAGIPSGTDCTVEPDRAKAIHLALARAGAGDTVVVCGKGHETTQTIGDTVIPFDDRKICAAF